MQKASDIPETIWFPSIKAVSKGPFWVGRTYTSKKANWRFNQKYPFTSLGILLVLMTKVTKFSVFKCFLVSSYTTHSVVLDNFNGQNILAHIW